MKRSSTIRVVLFGFAAIAAGVGVTAAGADEPALAGASPKRLKLEGHGAIVLQIPNAWRISATKPSGDLPPTIRMEPPSGGGFSVQITPIWKAASRTEPLTLPGLRTTVEAARDQIAGSATTRDLPIRDLQGGPVQGYYFSAEDKSSKGKPGDWRYVTQGSALLEDLVLTFTILSNDPNQPEAATTLVMLKTAKREAPQPGETPPPPAPLQVRVGLPDKPWALSLDMPGFKLDREQTLPDGAMMQAKNDDSHVIVSAFVERERKLDSVEACKKHYWGSIAKSPPKETDVHEVSKEGMIAVHYMIREFQGFTPNQKNINAYLYRDGACIDIHLSKVMYESQDEALFTAVLDTVRFVDKGEARPSRP